MTPLPQLTRRRLQAVSAIMGLPVDLLTTKVDRWQDRSARRLQVATPLRFDSLAVLAPLRADVDADDDSGLPPELAPALSRFAARPGRLLVEVTSRGPSEVLATELRARGRATLGADLALLGELSPAAGAVLGLIAEQLSPREGRSSSLGVGARVDEAGALGWSVSIVLDGDTTGHDVERIAAVIGATPPRCRLARQLHPTLSAGRPAVATLQLDGRATPGLTLTYHEVAFDTVVRLMAGLGCRLEDATLLGRIAGVCEVDHVAALSLGLRDHDRPDIRVALELMPATGVTAADHTLERPDLTVNL